VTHAPGRCLIFDAGVGSTVLEVLEENNLTTVDLVVVSHADADHLAGVGVLLLQPHIRVHSVMVNPDVRDSKEWTEFRIIVRDAGARGTTVRPSATTTDSPMQFEGVAVEILAPTPEVALATNDGRDLGGRSLSPNSMSVVVRVVVASTGAVLLPGDMDADGFQRLRAAHATMTAAVLVFPHHGGTAGTDEVLGFAEELTRSVGPRHVLFSLGRGRYGTPLPQVVAGTRRGAPQAVIACTQLSERCAAELPAAGPAHIGTIPAAGRTRRACCAGTMRFRLDAIAPMAPDIALHQEFITVNAPTALCRQS